jgi:hypothetical protein
MTKYRASKISLAQRAAPEVSVIQQGPIGIYAIKNCTPLVLYLEDQPTQDQQRTDQFPGDLAREVQTRFGENHPNTLTKILRLEERR